MSFNKSFILKCMLVLAIMPFTTAFAIEKTTEIETFIRKVKETNKFVEVNNIWSTDNNANKQELLEKVERVQTLTIDYANVASLVEKKTMAISLAVPAIGSGSYTIDLARYDFFTSDFELHAMGANNADGKVDYTPGVYYRGVVKGIPGSLAVFSFFNNEVYGIFSIPGEGNYNLVANTLIGNYYDNPHYILFNDKDLKITQYAPKCYTDELPAHAGDEPNGIVSLTKVGNEVYNSCTQVNVFEVGDYAMYLTKSKSVTKVANFLTSLFNNQSAIYRNEGIMINLKYMQVDSTTDAYQKITTASSGPFLDTFGKVTQSTLHGCDLALLASTALNGGYGALGGVAWLQSMCSKYNSKSFFGPYGFVDLDNSSTAVKFPTYSWDVEVLAHEMGHIVGSPHTHACVWNPPTRKTAIDGCYTLEGKCSMPVPQYPAAGGTIMSYCHLTSTGINFANGFGDQPGDTIRYFINKKFSATCGSLYTPTVNAISIANRTLTANRECTDMTSATTYYWYDNNTADQADDTLVLIIKKNGNSFGDLNTTGFDVMTGTITGYGTGLGYSVGFNPSLTTLMSGTTSIHRYWKVTTPTEPTSAVNVLFPFMATDTSDVNGTVPGAAPISGYILYKTDATVDPDPTKNALKDATSGVTLYANGGSASPTSWTASTLGTMNIAEFQTTTLSGGGSLIYTYKSTGIGNINEVNTNVYVYPNPSHDNWSISVSKNNGKDLSFKLYTVDGKVVRSQTLKSDSINTVNGQNLQAGMYFYKIVGLDNVYTGSVIKD
ncbi:MAG: C-terminal target protein [Flavipsychrobacter sp.]|nr:C-terminal target protein [Flavipsychrobacter sp.]